MQDTEIMIGGRLALVEKAHYAMFKRKQDFVARAITLDKVVLANPTDSDTARELGRTMSKIINQNRAIRRAGAFCKFVEN
jgi:hypothetical protein